MNYENFITALKEDLILSDYNDTISQKLPIINFYLKHYGPTIGINGQIIDFKYVNVRPISTKEDWIAMNLAFSLLVSRYNKGEFNK